VIETIACVEERGSDQANASMKGTVQRSRAIGWKPLEGMRSDDSGLGLVEVGPVKRTVWHDLDLGEGYGVSLKVTESGRGL
jgi:hypothetical protein